MKKTLLAVVVVALFEALLLAGCGAPAVAQNNGSPAPAKVAQSEKLTFPGNGYVMKFDSKAYKAGMNSVDDMGISVAIILDVSGSMGNPPQSGGQPKYLQATQALGTIVDYLHELSVKQPGLKVQVTLLKFSDNVSLVLPLTDVNKDYALVIAATASRNFQPDGGTAIGSALEEGSKILSQSGTILNSLTIITDGESNEGPASGGPGGVLDAIYQNRNNASTTDFRVTTDTQLVSFVGFDVDSPQFSDFHNHGARITAAGSRAEIEKGLKAFLEADITKLENK
jgi:hypothetical protein